MDGGQIPNQQWRRFRFARDAEGAPRLARVPASLSRDTPQTMSQENVEIVRRNYEVINQIDRTSAEFVDPKEAAPDLWSRLDADIELHERPDLPDAKVYRGRGETKEFWRKTQQLFSEVRWEPREFIDLGETVVVETSLTVVGRGSDVPIEAHETDVFWFRDGMIVRVQGVSDEGRSPGGGRAAPVEHHFMLCAKSSSAPFGADRTLA